MNYTFIINPISGSGDKRGLVAEIKQEMHKRNLNFEIHFTEHKRHGLELTRAIKKEKDITVVAVGGDGTVNEIGSQLLHTNIPLGIIPVGSGNGLARHLKIPLQPKKALNAILDGQSYTIDAGELNGSIFFVTCGFGFEAEVSHNFDQRNSRGLIGYVKEALKLFPAYKAERYSLEFNGKKETKKAFSITVANSSQYGNDAIIAKDASIADGLLDVCVIKSYPKLFGPQIGLSLFLKNLHNSSFFTTEQSKEVRITIENKKGIINGQIDGEAMEIKLPAKISCLHQSLKVRIPKT